MEEIASVYNTVPESNCARVPIIAHHVYVVLLQYAREPRCDMFQSVVRRKGLCRFGHVLLSVIAALGEVCRIGRFFFLVNEREGDMNIPKRSCWCKLCLGNHTLSF
jgi:hypothetical protein